MRLYYNSATPPAETWVRVSAIVGFPEITTRNNMAGLCIVTLRDFQGNLFSTWEPRDITEMLVTDDADADVANCNILFRGFLMKKAFHDRDLVLEIAGIGIMLYRRSFGHEEIETYILNEGFPKTLNANSQIDLQYKDLADAFQDFTWADDIHIKGDKDRAILIKDSTAGFNEVIWDCDDPIVVTGNHGAVVGDFASTITFDDNNYYEVYDITATPDLVITPTITGGAIPNTKKIKEIQIEYSFRARLDGIGFCDFNLEIKKDGSWLDPIDFIGLKSGNEWYNHTTGWLQALPDSLKEESVVKSITEGEDYLELAKYLTNAGGNFTQLQGMRFTITGHDLDTTAAKAYIHIDYIKVYIIYHDDDVLPIMRQITDSGASWVKCASVPNWQEMGITVDDDAFQIGENTRKILEDIGRYSGLSMNFGFNGTGTLTPNADIARPWTYPVGGTHYDEIDVDDAWYVQAQAADDGETEEFNFTTFTLTDKHAAAFISKLVLSVKAKDSGDSKAFGAGLYFDGSYQAGISVTLTGAYVTYTHTYNNVKLDQTELDALKVRLVSDMMGFGETISVSYVKVVATWSTGSVFSKYMARKFKGAHCIEPLQAVCELEGADWMEDYVKNQIKIIRVADFPDSTVSLTQADYDHDWEIEDICNQVKYVYVWGNVSYAVLNKEYNQTPTDPYLLKWIRKLNLESENIEFYKRKKFPGVGMGYDFTTDTWQINYATINKSHHTIHKLGHLWFYKKLNIMNIVKKNIAINEGEIDAKIGLPFGLILDTIINRKLFNMDKSFRSLDINDYVKAFQTSFYKGTRTEVPTYFKTCYYIEQYLIYNYLYPEELKQEFSNKILYELFVRQNEIIEESDSFTKKVFRQVNKQLRKFDSIKDSENLVDITNYIIELYEQLPYWDRDYLKEQVRLRYRN